MAKRVNTTELDASSDKGLEEIDAQREVYLALRDLDQTAQLRVLRNGAEMLGLTLPSVDIGQASDNQPPSSNDDHNTSTISTEAINETADGDGISPIAMKWMRRSGFAPKDLQPLFSLGIDEIDLVAKAIPGTATRERFRNVLLLKCIAAYLSSGTARVTDEQLREASTHYKAYDQSNFAKYIKAFSSEVGGSKSSGYSLTPRGMTSATELVQNLLAR